MQEEKVKITDGTETETTSKTIAALIARIRELEDENKKLRHAIIAQWLGVENE